MPEFRVLSFGGGTQSAWLLDQHIRGKYHYDLIAFADTGAEPKFIHDQVAWWQERVSQEVGTPFRIVRHGSMLGGLEEMLFRYIYTDYDRFQMVAHCGGGGMLPRQCTVDFKIVPVQREARRVIMGDRKTFPKDTTIVMDIGFAADEERRAKRRQSMQYKYVRLDYPMIDAGITVDASIQYLREHELPDKRSRCYLCPFQSDAKPGMSWREVIEQEPFSFIKACWLDDQLRAVQATGTKRMRSVPYLHHSRRPLREVYADDFNRLNGRYTGSLEDWISAEKSTVTA